MRKEQANSGVPGDKRGLPRRKYSGAVGTPSLPAVASIGLALLFGLGCEVSGLVSRATPTPEPTEEPTPESDVALVRTTQALDVLSGPAADCTVIGGHAEGDEVPVKAITLEHMWWQVEVGDDGRVGWMEVAYTTPVNDVSDVLEMPGPPCAIASVEGGDTPGGPATTGEQTTGGNQPPPPQPGQGDGEKEPFCGDGVMNGLENCEVDADCELGGANHYCNESCQCIPRPRCGDGFLSPGEVCESQSDCGTGRFCNTSCQCELYSLAVCGNGVVEEGEACESTADCTFGGLVSGMVCGSNCQCQALGGNLSAPNVCGNGICESGEYPSTCPACGNNPCIADCG